MVTDADEIRAERVIDTGAKAGQYIQTSKYKGKSRTLFYKDPRIEKFEESISMKILKGEPRS